MAIDFSFTPDQDHLREAARQFLQQRCPTSVVRELEDTELGYDPAVWREIAGLGWLGLTVPEQYGGAGAEFLTLVPLYEEMGRVPMHNIVPRLEASPGRLRRPAPKLGEHTAEVLARIGIAGADLARLKSERIV